MRSFGNAKWVGNRGHRLLLSMVADHATNGDYDDADDGIGRYARRYFLAIVLGVTSQPLPSSPTNNPTTNTTTPTHQTYRPTTSSSDIVLVAPSTTLLTMLLLARLTVLAAGIRFCIPPAT